MAKGKKRKDAPERAPEAPASAPEAPPATPSASQVPQGQPSAVRAAARIWFSAYRAEVLLFLASFIVLAGFSGERFLRQSAAPHFVYQAKAWLEGRIDLDPEVLPNLEDWACVREMGGEKTRCAGRPQPSDKWYVSFPPFPALLMLPFVAVNGYQFNDTSFGVLIGALAVSLFYALLRSLTKMQESPLGETENMALAAILAVGTLFFYCAIRGEVWFSAEVLGVALTCLYARYAVRAQKPMLAGLFYSMATLTRTPLLFTGLFFVLEVFCPGPNRLEQLSALGSDLNGKLRRVGLFAAGAAPLAILAALFNKARFGKFSEFGHSFLFNNRVNADIDQWGLFNLVYLPRNLVAAFFLPPDVATAPLRLGYNPHGLSLLLTLPLLVFIFVPKFRPKVAVPIGVRFAIFAAPFILRAIRVDPNGYLLPIALLALAWLSMSPEQPRLNSALWLTVAVTALPGLLYQNDGFAQFGFRFSLDYTPYLLLLFALSGWALKNRYVIAAVALGVLVNFWGAVAFRGYTELVRNW